MHGLPSFIQCSPGGKGPQLKYHCTKEKQILLKHPACYTILIIDATVNYPIQWIKTIDRCLTLVHKKSRYFWNTQYTTLYWCYCPIQMLNISTQEKRILLERPVYYTILILRSTTYDRRMKTKDRCSAFPPPEFTMFTRGKGKKSLILLSSHAAVSTVGAGVSDPNPLADRIFYSDGRF